MALLTELTTDAPREEVLRALEEHGILSTSQAIETRGEATAFQIAEGVRISVFVEEKIDSSELETCIELAEDKLDYIEAIFDALKSLSYRCKMGTTATSDKEIEYVSQSSLPAQQISET